MSESSTKDVFEYRIRIVFPGPVGPKTKRDLSDVCSRLIGANLKLIGVRPQLIRSLNLFYVVMFGILGVLFLDVLDQIVNVVLYDYGLQFSPVWYGPYQTFEKLTYVSLGVIIVIGAVYLVFSLRRVRLIWKHRKLIRSYDPIFLEDTDRAFKKFHTVEIHLYPRKKRGFLRRS